MNIYVATLLMLLLCPQLLYAQLLGKVTSDVDSAPIPYVTVSTFDENGAFLYGIRGDVHGEFSLSIDKKIVKISFQAIGFERKDTICANGFNGDIGTVVMSPWTENLSEVVVVGDRAKKDASVETIYISDSLSNGTVNTIQLLSKIQGINIDWGTDEIRIGKDRNVPVVVNGKEMKWDYVININPKRIKRVEIMRYPAGKYSEYPIVLNLVLINDYMGWDVSTGLRAMYSFRNKHSNRESLGTSFTYSFDRVSLYGNMDIFHRHVYDASDYEYNGEQIIKTGEADYKDPNTSVRSNGGGVSLGIDYKLMDNHSLSFQGWYEKKDARDQEHYYVKKKTGSYWQYTHDNFETDDYTFGVFYNGMLWKKLKLASELVYNGYNIHESRLFSNDGVESQSPYYGEKNYWRYYLSASYALNKYWSLAADYTQTWKDYSNKERTSGETLYKSNEIRGKAMLALSYRPSRYFNVVAGTHVLRVKNDDKQTMMSDSHISWMPIFKSYFKPSKFVIFLINYYCNVQYPNLDQLSTVEWQSNDVLWYRGNKNLKPTIMHYSEITVDFTNIIKLTYMLKHCKDEMVDFYIQDGSRTYKTQTNCNYLHNYLGIEGDYQLTKGVRMSLVGNYQWYNRHLKGGSKHFGRTWYIDSNVSWNVPNTRLGMMASYFLRHDKFPMLQGKKYNEEEDFLFGLSYSLLKGNLSIAMTVKIPTALISKKIYTQIDIPNFRYNTSGDNRVNAFCTLLNVKYNLGKGKISRNDNNKNTDTEK